MKRRRNNFIINFFHDIQFVDGIGKADPEIRNLLWKCLVTVLLLLFMKTDKDFGAKVEIIRFK